MTITGHDVATSRLHSSRLSTNVVAEVQNEGRSPDEEEVPRIAEGLWLLHAEINRYPEITTTSGRRSHCYSADGADRNQEESQLA